jgi:hypothetical protein
LAWRDLTSLFPSASHQVAGLHALAPHYTNSLRPFFRDVLHTADAPLLSGPQLLAALHTLQTRPPDEATARLSELCVRRLADDESDAWHELNGDAARGDQLGGGGMRLERTRSAGCPLHGPGCTHPACASMRRLAAALADGARMPRGGLSSRREAGAAQDEDGEEDGENGENDGDAEPRRDALSSVGHAQQMVDAALSSSRHSAAQRVSRSVRADARRSAADGGAAAAQRAPVHPCSCHALLELEYAFVTSTGVRVYTDVRLSPSEMSPQRVRRLAEQLGGLLHSLCALLMPYVARSVHVYVDAPRDGNGAPRAETFAFNERGALFFSARAFGLLHGELPRPLADGSCASFWLVALCHQLAHNLEPRHDGRHEALTEALLQAALPRLLAGDHVQPGHGHVAAVGRLVAPAPLVGRDTGRRYG